MLAQPEEPKQAPVVYAIIPAYGRPELLARALASLRDQGPALRGAIVVNNSGDDQTTRVAREATVPVTLVTPRCNLGTAGGIAAGLQAFRAEPAATHAWILDDDSVATPGALDAMLAAMRESGAEAAMPLLADESDRVYWVPCGMPYRQRKFVQRGPTVAEFRREFGVAPRPWTWATWASVLFSRRAVEAAGYPQLELWSQFTDVEYTLRLTARFSGVLAPLSVCRHLPPSPVGQAFDGKLYSALQNGSYVGFRLRHGWRALRHLAGLNFRYLRHYHWQWRAWLDPVTAFFCGAILSRPSGRTVHAAQYEAAQAAWSEMLHTKPPD